MRKGQTVIYVDIRLSYPDDFDHDQARRYGEGLADHLNAHPTEKLERAEVVQVFRPMIAPLRPVTSEANEPVVLRDEPEPA